MKKSIILLISLFFLGSFPALGIAQQQASPVSKAPSLAPKPKSLTGKVDSVSLADPAKEVRSELLVTDTSNKTFLFFEECSKIIVDYCFFFLPLITITTVVIIEGVKYFV